MLSSKASYRKQAFLKWLFAGWYVYAMAIALVLVVTFQVLPRVERFIGYWYETSNPVLGQTLAQDRLVEWTHEAWLQVVAVPVGFLFFTHLFGLMAVFRESPLPEERGVEDSQPSRINKALVKPVLVAPLTSSPKITTTTVNLGGNVDTERTQIRSAVSMDDELIRYIGPNNKYRVDSILGSGGMGSVYQGFDTSLQREVALKSLHMELAQGDDEQIARFRTEAYSLAGLSHQNIVPVYDLFEEGNEFWMVIELLEGGDLDQRIERQLPSIKQSVAIIRAVAKGLEYAHNKNFIHRDVKPMNILFNADHVPKLVDFGIAKERGSAHVAAKTMAGLALGSPTYMSPEQATGQADLDRRTDIYSLGITFYKMLTGTVPFTGEVTAVMRQHITQTPQAPRDINPAISEQLNQIVLKMIAKEREVRYQTAAEFIADLDQYRAASIA
jgi:hypothetical protein